MALANSASSLDEFLRMSLVDLGSNRLFLPIMAGLKTRFIRLVLIDSARHKACVLQVE